MVMQSQDCEKNGTHFRVVSELYGKIKGKIKNKRKIEGVLGNGK